MVLMTIFIYTYLYLLEIILYLHFFLGVPFSVNCIIFIRSMLATNILRIGQSWWNIAVIGEIFISTPYWNWNLYKI